MPGESVMVAFYNNVRKVVSDLAPMPIRFVQGFGFDSAANAVRTNEIDPVDHHDLGQTIMDDSGVGDGDTDSAMIDMEHCSSLTLQIEDTPGTAGDNAYTIFASNMNVAPTSATFHDVTATFIAKDNTDGAASYVTSDFLRAPAGFKARWVYVHRFRQNDGANTDGGTSIYAWKGP